MNFVVTSDSAARSLICFPKEKRWTSALKKMTDMFPKLALSVRLLYHLSISFKLFEKYLQRVNERDCDLQYKVCLPFKIVLL